MKFLILFLSLNLNSIFAQQPVSVTELENKLRKEQKHVVIKLYTDWCGICAIQDKKIQKDEALVAILNDEFYFVKFNAESKESFVFKGHEFENQDGKIHGFAKEVSPDSNAFPAWIIMNPELEIIFQYNGLIENEDLKTILFKLKDL